MRITILSAASLATCLAFSACSTPQDRAERHEDLLAAAGFTVRPSNTPERVASLQQLPPNKVVMRAHGGDVRYVYADPIVCNCLYVGDQAAYGRYRQEILARHLANQEQATARMNEDSWNEGPWGPMWY